MSRGLAGGRPRSGGPFIVVASIVGALAVALVTLLGPVVGPAGAHTDLLQGSPGPGQRVGGTVDFVDLVFLAPVTDVAIEVTGPDGALVDGEVEVPDGQIIRFRMDAVTAPGRYVVDYQMVSDDGDLTRSSYFFQYEPGAFEPARLGQGDIAEPGVVTTRNVVGVASVVALGSVCLVLAARFRRSRTALVAHRQGRNG